MRIFLILVACGMAVPALAQSNFYYPVSFTAYFQNMSQITPAYVPEEGKAEFTSGYKSLTGAFRKISSYYFTACRTFRKENAMAHTLRMQFYNEKEGSYISSPRLYGNYAYSLPLNEHTSLYSGIALGLAGTYYSAPTTTQSSFTLPDGSVGVGIKSNWFDFGGSLMQVFNSSYSPVVSVVKYARYSHLYLVLQKEWASEWGVKGQLLWRHLPHLTEELYGTFSLYYAKRMEFGAILKYQGALSIFTLIGISNHEDRLDILLNYNSPFFGLVPAYQSNLEIGLRYRLE